MAVDLSVQIAAANRELAMRRVVYPRRVAEKRMTELKAAAEIAAMEAIVRTLEGLQAVRPVWNITGTAGPAVDCVTQAMQFLASEYRIKPLTMRLSWDGDECKGFMVTDAVMPAQTPDLFNEQKGPAS